MSFGTIRAGVVRKATRPSARAANRPKENLPKRWASIQVKATRMGKQSAAQKHRTDF